MAGSAITQALTVNGMGDDLNAVSKQLKLSWTGDHATGAVPTLAIAEFAGWWLTKAVTNPGAVPPTAAYDITLVDADGADLADGALLDRSRTLTEVETMAVQIPAAGFTFTMTGNTDASAVGTCELYFNKDARGW